jgi:hypothetical protein
VWRALVDVYSSVSARIFGDEPNLPKFLGDLSRGPRRPRDRDRSRDCHPCGVERFRKAQVLIIIWLLGRVGPACARCRTDPAGGVTHGGRLLSRYLYVRSRVSYRCVGMGSRRPVGAEDVACYHGCCRMPGTARPRVSTP